MNSKRLKLIARFKIVTQYGLAQFTVIVAQLVLSLLVIKTKSSALWGEYVELLLWVNLPAIITHFGNKSYLLKAFSENPASIYQTWLSSLLTRGLLYAVIVATVIWIPLFKPYILFIVIWIFLLYINQSFEALIIYHRDFKLSLFTEAFRNTLLIVSTLFCLPFLDLKLLIVLVLIAALLKTISYTSYYFRKFNNLSFTIDFSLLSVMLPFFIPMILGTIRTKVDAYYGTLFFTKADLAQYQIFTSLLGFVAMGGSYVVNPYLKNFYRASKSLANKLMRQFVKMGIAIAFLALPIIYIVITYVYSFNFSGISYALGLLFLLPIFLHYILINDFYKRDKQSQIAWIIGIFSILQIFLGYFFVKNFYIEGALGIKVLGQWLLIACLLVFRKLQLKAN